MDEASPAPSAAVADGPYVGLRHYVEEDAENFFGRRTESEVIVSNLRAARLTLLYAESGVGKSSLLRAGVTARLRALAARDARERGAPRLVPVVFSSWSEQPTGALIAAIADAIEPFTDGEADFLVDSLHAALDAATKATGAKLLVILDQFEEYFQYQSRDEGELAHQLARCVNEPGLRANFLISIREDAYARLGDLFQGRIANVYRNFLHLEYLSTEEAREAIEGPIDRDEIEPELVEAVLSSEEVRRGSAAAGRDGDRAAGDAGTDQVEATNLQLVMKRLWEERAADSPCLRLTTLERLGGAKAIIGHHLDDSMATLGPDEQRTAAAAFRFLVTREGTKIPWTAASLADRVSELAGQSDVDEPQLESVLRRLSAGDLHILRPVSPRDGQGAVSYEIFHDALARPIADWRARQDAERLESERRAREDADRAKREAEAREARERQRKRWALAGLGAAIVALIAGAIVFAIVQANRASDRKKTAQSIEAAERISGLSPAPSFGPTAAGLASVEASRLWPTFEARNQTLAALQLDTGLARVAVGHTRGALAVSFFPGSRRLASTGSDGTIRIWDAKGRELGRPIVPPVTGYWPSVAVSPLGPSGRRILAVGGKTGVRLWDVTHPARPRALGPLPLPRGHVSAVAFDPRAANVLAVATGPAIGLWNLLESRQPRRIGAVQAPGTIRGMAFAASGKFIFTSGDGGEEVGRLSGSFALQAVKKLATQSGCCIAVAPNRSYAYAVGKSIHVSDAPDDRSYLLQTTGTVRSLAFAHHGSVLVSGGDDWNVTTWDMRSGQPFGPPRVHNKGSVYGVAVSPDGRTIASAGLDGFVKLWPFKPDGALATTVGALSAGQAGGQVPVIFDLSLGTGGRLAVAAGYSGAFISRQGLHRAAPAPLTRVPTPNGTYIPAVAYHGTILAVASGSSFHLWDTSSSCEQMPQRPCFLGASPQGKGFIRSLAFSADGKLLAAAGDDGRLRLWDVSDPASINLLGRQRSPQNEEINQIAFSPVNPLIATAGQDGNVRVWNIADPRHPALVGDPLSIHDAQPVTAVAFSPSGALLASGGRDQQVALSAVSWDPAARQAAVRKIPGTLYQTNTIEALAFSPDGETLAAGDGDGSVCLYDVATRRKIGSNSCLIGHYPAQVLGGVRSVRFTPDGKALLTAGSGDPIVAWSSLLWSRDYGDQASTALRSHICAIAARNLTGFEWGEIFAGTDLAADRHATCPRYPLP